MDFETFCASLKDKKREQIVRAAYHWFSEANLTAEALILSEAEVAHLTFIAEFMRGFIERHGLAETFKEEASRDTALQTHYQTRGEQWQNGRQLIAAALVENGRLSVAQNRSEQAGKAGRAAADNMAPQRKIAAEATAKKLRAAVQTVGKSSAAGVVAAREGVTQRTVRRRANRATDTVKD